MLVKSDLTSKDTSLWSSGICIVLIASMKLSVDCSLCRDLSVKGLRMLVKCCSVVLLARLSAIVVRVSSRDVGISSLSVLRHNNSLSLA